MSNKTAKSIRRQARREAKNIALDYIEQNSVQVIRASIEVLQKKPFFKVRIFAAFNILFGTLITWFKIKSAFFCLLDWTWCLPQTLLGFILTYTLWHGAKKEQLISANFYTVVSLGEKRKGKLYNYLSGFSLGRYICLHYHFADIIEYEQTIRHECGHTRQSRRLGWLYLPIVGIPSVINNLRSGRNAHIAETYYERYPEKYADQLGGVKR